MLGYVLKALLISFCLIPWGGEAGPIDLLNVRDVTYPIFSDRGHGQIANVQIESFAKENGRLGPLRVAFLPKWSMQSLCITLNAENCDEHDLVQIVSAINELDKKWDFSGVRMIVGSHSVAGSSLKVVGKSVRILGPVTIVGQVNGTQAEEAVIDFSSEGIRIQWREQ
jgi:hypothetical protein